MLKNVGRRIISVTHLWKQGTSHITLCGVLKSDNYIIIITEVRVVHGTIKSLTNKSEEEAKREKKQQKKKLCAGEGRMAPTGNTCYCMTRFATIQHT